MLAITTNTIDVKPDELRDLWCVYSHAIPPYDTLFFVGVSKLRDLYDFTDAFRNNYWRMTVKNETVVRVTLLGASISVPECNQHMRALIEQFRPVCNIKGYAITGSTMVTCTQGANAGTSYSSQLDAAEKNGLTPGAMSNHLNGRKGYEVIRGMKFKRGSL